VLGVLLDDREQIAEQPPLGRRQLRALDRRGGRPGRELIDGRPGGDQRTGLGAAGRSAVT
jgi:hypothetical protein